ncbi:MAG: WG repeat-containing protein [Erysipelotrichaceae bacterium]
MKKFSKVLLAMVMMVSLAACGESKSGSSKEVLSDVNHIVDGNGLIVTYLEKGKDEEGSPLFVSGLANKDGKEVVKAEYEMLYPLVNEYYYVQKDGLAGIIDANGSVVGKIDAYNVFYSSKQIIVSRDNESDIYDTSMKKINTIKGEIVDTCENGYIVSNKGKMGIVNKDNKKIVDYKYSEIYGSYKNDKCLGLIANDEDGNFDLFDPSGKQLNKDTYRAATALTQSSKENTFNQDSDYIAVNKDGKTGILDYKGKTIIPFEYDPILNEMDMSEEESGNEQEVIFIEKQKAFVLYQDGNPVIVNMKNEPILKFSVVDKESASFNAENATSFNMTNTYYDGAKTHYLNDDLKETLTIDGVGSHFVNGIASVQQGDGEKTLLINDKGETILETGQSDEAGYQYDTLMLDNGFITYEKSNEMGEQKFGVLDQNAKELLSVAQGEESDFNVSFRVLKNGDEISFLETKEYDSQVSNNTVYDKTGKKLNEFKGEVQPLDPFTNSKLMVFSQSYDKYKYDEEEETSTLVGRYDINNKKNFETQGIIDLNGKEVVKPMYREAQIFSDYIVVENEKSSSIIDKKTFKEVVKAPGKCKFITYSNQ